MKNKGFTLIELLAVILIISTIALIAIPIVNNIVKESKKSAFESSVNNIVQAIEDTCHLEAIKGEEITTTYTFIDGVIYPGLNIKGKLPTSGAATVDTKCNVSIEVMNTVFAASKLTTENKINTIDVKKYNISLLLNGDSNVVKSLDGTNYIDMGATAIDTDNKNLSSSITTVIKKDGVIVDSVSSNDVATYTITYSILKYGKTYSKTRTLNIIGNSIYANGTAVYFNPVSGTKCTAGEVVSTTGTKTGCMKWYAFNDEGVATNTINLILDHNTTNYLQWNSTGNNLSSPTYILTSLQNDTSSWTGVPTRTDSYSVNNGTSTYTINYNGYKARLITISEIAKITGNTIFNETTSTSDGWFYLDGNSQNQKASNYNKSIYYWLYDYTSCSVYGCNIADSNTHGYWTSTAVTSSTNLVWLMYKTGSILGNSPSNNLVAGIRPVITIPKSLL